LWEPRALKTSKSKGDDRPIFERRLPDSSKVNADSDSIPKADPPDTTESGIQETPEVSALAAELATEKSRYLRLAADFDNFRKRVSQESDRRAAVQKKAFIQELLPIIDNLERAVASNAAASSEQILQGVQITLQQLHQLLRRHNIEPEESVGRPFDPHYHEAVASRYEPSQPDHVVLETLQRGYRYGSESLRAAKVVVNDLSKGESPDSKD
jgi:molecular chaperone GrpE